MAYAVTTTGSPDHPFNFLQGALILHPRICAPACLRHSNDFLIVRRPFTALGRVKMFLLVHRVCGRYSSGVGSNPLLHADGRPRASRPPGLCTRGCLAVYVDGVYRSGACARVKRATATRPVCETGGGEVVFVYGGGARAHNTRFSQCVHRDRHRPPSRALSLASS